MLKITITGTPSFEAQFSTEAELNEYIAKHEAMGTFNLTEKTEVTTDIEGNEIVTVIPVTHTFVIKDITAEIAAADAVAKARKDAKASARTMLKTYKDGTFKVTKLKDMDDLLMKVLDLIDLDGEA